MEQFRTELTITPRPMFHHGSAVVTAGSCFSDNIGQKLSESKFKTLVNPLGVCYNPLSIHKCLLMDRPDEDLFIESQGLWKHFDFHSRFSATSKEALRKILEDQLSSVRSFLLSADIIMLTYGTAWVYRHKATGNIVANCHKRPQVEFEKLLLTTEQIVESFGTLRSLNKKIIVTLSPVRHIKDTLELNNVSKSVVRHAIHLLKDVDYFPAYEIMMDDLRDYRFYDADMIHPSDVAIDYIWEKFGERYFSTETKELNARWEKVRRSLKHNAFQPSSQQHKDFLRRLLTELSELKTAIDVSHEVADIEHRLNA